MSSRLFKQAARSMTVGILCLNLAFAQQAQIDIANWASITAPVYGSTETGAYSGTELFAGPNKFGSYNAGVLPNGRKVTPAGVVTQVGMNPLGLVLTPD